MKDLADNEVKNIADRIAHHMKAKEMYALVWATPKDAGVVAISEDVDKLRALLKEKARDYAHEMSGYDEDNYDAVFRQSIEEADLSWIDEGCDYFYSLNIERAEVI